MKSLHPDDPRLTAYVLGELSSAEARLIEREALLRPEIQAEIDELELVRENLSKACVNPALRLDPARRQNILLAGSSPQVEKLVSVDRRRRWRRAVVVIGAAAVFVLAAVWALKNTPVTHSPEVVVDTTPLTEEEEVLVRVLLEGVDAPKGLADFQVSIASGYGNRDEVAPPADAEFQKIANLIRNNPDQFFEGVEKDRVMAALPNLLRLPSLKENPFVSSRQVARTRIPVTSGSSGYNLVECFVRREGVLPPRATVRIEELINHVPYRDTGDAVLDDVMLGAELVQCPWDPEKLLLSVLVQNRSDKLLPSDTALSLDVKSDAISSYRLIGYASGGEIGSGGLHRGLEADRSNMVLYELRPSSRGVFNQHKVLCRVGLTLGSESDRALIVPVTSPPRDWGNASLNVRTAAVIAGYGMVLRESHYRGELNAELLGELAQEVLKDKQLTVPQQQDALELVCDSLGLLASLDQ